jgi:hypothetical protein
MLAAAIGNSGRKSEPTTVADHTQVGPETMEVLSWLPADTETFISARGPFVFPSSESKRQDYADGDRRIEAHELREVFQGLALGPLGLNNGGLEKKLLGTKVRLAAEGSRSFRSPGGLGELPYEGCSIVIFMDDVVDRRDEFMKDSTKNAVRIEAIESHKVAVFQQKMEEDTWTTFVAFPWRNVVAVATGRPYLQEVLARMRMPKTNRTFPETLAEWKYIDAHAEFWGMRNCNRSQSQLDPTSPFGGQKPANLPDERAIGLTFQCDPAKEFKAKLVYLSDDKDKVDQIERNRFPPGTEVESTGALHIAYRNLSPGVVESSYDLSRSRPLSWFFFVFMAQLGHALYV